MPATRSRSRSRGTWRAARIRPRTTSRAAAVALDWLVESLRTGAVPGVRALRTLRDQAAAEARAVRPMQPVLDRALSAGWVLWGWVAERHELTADGLRALGDALLRTGDAAAAAIADGHAAAEREIATRSASALRELLDELLDLGDGDEPGRARLARRAGELGIPVERPLTVVVADAGRDLEDADPAVVGVARRLVPGIAPSVGDPRALGAPIPGPVVGATHGRLVVLVPATPRSPDVAAALEALGDDWVATSAPADGLLGASHAAREATAALAVARRIGRRAEVVPAVSLGLERALLAEPALLRAAVDRELGPLLDVAPGRGPRRHARGVPRRARERAGGGAPAGDRPADGRLPPGADRAAPRRPARRRPPAAARDDAVRATRARRCRPGAAPGHDSTGGGWPTSMSALR